MRVLVVGGTAFLGSFVVDELLRRRHQVAVLGAEAGEFRGPVSRLDGLPSDGRALREAVGSWQPEGVIDLVHDGPAQAASVAGAARGGWRGRSTSAVGRSTGAAQSARWVKRQR